MSGCFAAGSVGSERQAAFRLDHRRRTSTLTLVDHKVLVQAITTAFMSHDQSGDVDVNPDWAVKIMGDLTHTLSQLSDADPSQFRADLEGLASDLSTDPFNGLWRNYYRVLPDLMGWD